MSAYSAQRFCLICLLLLTITLANFPLPAYADGPLPTEDTQPDLGVDVLTGVPVVPASAAAIKTPRAWAGPNAPQALLLDDFNRTDGPLGSNWTLRSPITTSFNVVNNTARGGVDAISTYNLPSGASGAEVDVIATSTNIQYVGLVLDYNPNTNNKILIKVQGQVDDADFDVVGCYAGVNAQDAFGPGVIALSTPIVTARMQVTIDITRNVIINFSNVNGGAGTQTYMCAGAPTTGGNQIGIASLITSDGALDNFSVLNVAPIANDDSYNLTEDTSLVIAASGILSNDTDMEMSPLSATVLNNPSNGALTLTTNGAFTYTPNANFFGTDVFTYTASDGALTDTARVTLTVAPVSDPPIANDNTYTTLEDTPFNVTAPGVLGNDTDPDGTPLTVTLVSGTNNGTVTLQPNGVFTYTPTLNFFGTDTFVYQASDGTLTDPAVVTITVTAVNDIPVAINDTYVITEDVTLNIPAPGVLSNDTDVEGNTLFATGASGISHGTLTLRSNGSAIYTPTENYTGLDVFTYRVWDLDITKFTVGVVTITVLAVNDPPLARNDVYTTAEDTSLAITATLGVLANDSEYDGTSISATLQTNVTHGGLALNSDGSFIYLPAGNYNGLDFFTYSITDGVFTATATVTLNVTAVNDAPIAVANVYTTAEDTPLMIAAPGVLGNDSDVEMSTLTTTLQSGPSQGGVVLGLNGAFTYTPAANFFGTDVFTYVVSDGNLTATAPVTLNVTAVNDAPVANDNAYVLAEDTPLVLTAPGVLTNDTDVDLNVLSATVQTAPTHGSLVLGLNGAFTYTPALNFFGTDTFVYIASDGLLTDTAIVTLTITAVDNDAPIVNSDVYSTAEDTPLITGAPGVLGNDTEPDLQPLTATVVSPVSSGVLSLQPNGAFTYTPALNFFGVVTFTYAATDGMFTNTTQVTLTVVSVNDAPIANSESYTTTEDTTLNIAAPGLLGNDSDVDLNPITAAFFAAPANGVVTISANGAFTYTPALNFFGTDVFTYVVSDGTLTATASVTINVTAVNNDAPVANDDTYLTAEDTPLFISASGVLSNDVEPDLQPFTATLVSNVVTGSLNFNSNGAFLYTPPLNFFGVVTFTYQASDGGLTDLALVTITVTSVNDAPIANDNVYTTTEDTPLSIAAPGLLVNDTDVESSLTVSLSGSPSGGVVTLNPNGAFTFTPTLNFFGLATFTYIASDGNLTDTAQVTITVTSVNDAPLANDNVYTTTEDNSLIVGAPGVLGNDSDAEFASLTAVLLSSTSHGSLNFNANGAFAYAPAANYFGTDVFMYYASDGVLTTTAIVTINVTPVGGDVPVVNNDTYTTSEDVVLNVTQPGVMSNDVEPDVEPMTATLLSSVSNGTLNFWPNGSFVYTPPLNFFGPVTFTYAATDGLFTGTATATISVIAVNDAPVANDNVYSIAEDTALVVTAPSGVLSNDTDVEPGPLTATVQTGPTHGTLMLSQNGAFTYTPAANFFGADTFVYVASDGVLTDSALVTITVTAVTGDAPVANDDTYTTPEDTPLLVAASGVLGNDLDPDLETLTAALVNDVSSGILTLNPNGAFGYTPTLNFFGVVSFTYQVSDGVLTETAVVTLTVTSVNDAPVANNDTYTTSRNIALIVPLPGTLGNDVEYDGQPMTPTLVSGPSNGTLNLRSDGTFTYTPANNFVGSDSFVYLDSDGTLTDTATVFIIITAANNPPIANDNTYTLTEDVVLSVAYPGVLGNDTDPEVNTLRATIFTPPTHGSVILAPNGAFTYTPAANFFGTDTFVYLATDGDLADSALVTLNVTAVDDAPLANNDSYTITRNIPLVVPTLGVLGNDVEYDGQPVTPTLVSSPSNGSLTFRVDGSFTYTPVTNFTGVDSFAYMNSDGALTDTAFVLIAVTAFNNPPLANDNVYTATEDTPLVVTAPGVLGNDTDPDLNVLRATLFTSPTHGVVTLQLNGSFTYTPAPNFFGTDTFVYQATDGGLNDTAVVTITVTPVGGDAPVASDDVYTTAKNIPLNIAPSGVLSNDVDPDLDALTVVLQSTVATGTLTLQPNGAFIYSPTLNFTGTVSFVYAASDGGLTDTATVSITVVSTNEAPNANDDTYTTAEDTTLNIVASGVLGNDTDVDLNPLTVTLQTGPSNGLLSLSPNGAFSYTPALNFFGTDTFTYIVSDGVLTDTASVTITVTAVNDAPTIQPMSTQTVTVNTVGVITVVISDVETLANGLVLTATSSMPNILPNSGIVVSGTGYTRTLLVSPVLTGTTVISLTVTDSAGLPGTLNFNLVVIPHYVYMPFINR